LQKGHVNTTVEHWVPKIANDNTMYCEMPRVSEYQPNTHSLNYVSAEVMKFNRFT
jgi:hypothetical protein